ncbi:MAG: flavin reductase family protein [Rhodospirillaceae bacterium]|nr:flavin reductase family protein [Rhodospirillaceae bacterium]
MANEAIFKKGMSLLAGGVTLITTGTEATRRGITATAVCSLSATPPSLIACANKDTGTAKAIIETGVFAVNVIGESHKDLSMIFAGATGVSGEDRFKHGNWASHNNDVPYLEDAVAVFICETAQHISHGTHYAFVANVKDVILINENETPIAWLGSSFHNLSSLG